MGLLINWQTVISCLISGKLGKKLSLSFNSLPFFSFFSHLLPPQPLGTHFFRFPANFYVCIGSFAKLSLRKWLTMMKTGAKKKTRKNSHHHHLHEVVSNGLALQNTSISFHLFCLGGFLGQIYVILILLGMWERREAYPWHMTRQRLCRSFQPILSFLWATPWTCPLNWYDGS